MNGDDGGFDGDFGDYDGDFDQEGFDDDSFDEGDESMSLEDSCMEPTIDESVLDSMIDDFNSQKESDEDTDNETDEVSDESDIESVEVSDENLENIEPEIEFPEEPLIVTEEKIEEFKEDNQELSIEEKAQDAEPKVTFSEPYMKVSEAGIERCLDSTGHIRAKGGEKLPGNDPEVQRVVIESDGVVEEKKLKVIDELSEDDEVSEEEIEEVNELDKEPEEMEARAEYRQWYMNKGNEVLSELGRYDKEWKTHSFRVPRHYEQEPKLTHDGEKYTVAGTVTADTSAFNSVDFRRAHPEIFDNEHWKYQRIFDDVFDMATSHAAINDAEGKESMERKFNEMVKFEFGDKINREIENLGSNNPKTVERATEKLNLLERNLTKAKQLWINNAFKE